MKVEKLILTVEHDTDPQEIAKHIRNLVANIEQVRSVNVEWENAAILSSNKRLEERVKEFERGIVIAIKTIRMWLGLGRDQGEEENIWKLYQHSPEMKRLNALLSQKAPQAQKDMDNLFSIRDIEKAFDLWAKKWCVAEDTWPEAWHDFFVWLIPVGAEKAMAQAQKGNYVTKDSYHTGKSGIVGFDSTQAQKGCPERGENRL